MAFGIFLLFIIGTLYLLLVKGYLWKLIIGIFGCIGLCTFLSNIDGCKSNALTVGDFSLSGAALVAIIILLLAAACSKIE